MQMRGRTTKRAAASVACDTATPTASAQLMNPGRAVKFVFPQHFLQLSVVLGADCKGEARPTPNPAVITLMLAVL